MASQAQLTQSDLKAMAQQVSNWGRWGDDDELGALNLITPAKRAAAASLVREGLTVSCALALAKTPAPDNPRPVMHQMAYGGDVPDGSGSADYFAIYPHGLANTHLDALCHVFVDGKMYNGFDKSEVRSDGAQRGSIMAAKDGIMSRGILLDIPALRGVEWLEPTDRIARSELEAAEKRQGVRVEEGDILLVRTGRDLRGERLGRWDPYAEGLAGISTDCVPYLHERGVAVLGGDGISDAWPSITEGWRSPIHQMTLVLMGVHLIDNMQLSRLAEACAERQRWEFLLTVAPLRLELGTASPVNPIALF